MLWPVSLIYQALVAMRRWLYARGLLQVTHLPVPVVVVGNLVVGGAGKTPTTLALLAGLRSRGWNPGVVSRGYGRSSKEVLEVDTDTPASAGGDEPTLIRQQAQVPVFVGSRRVDAARALLAAHPEVDVIVCDDGLQHLALGRNVAIAVFDDRATGNGWTLPAGLLREPWPPARPRPYEPDLLLVHQSAGGTAMPSALPSGGKPVFTATRRLATSAHDRQGRQRALSDFADQQGLVALAGIARPQPFFDMLRASGLSLAQTISLADHAPAAAYEALSLAAGTTVLCTEKDAVKLFALQQSDPRLASLPCWAVALDTDIEAPFFDAVLDRLPAPRGPRL